MKKCILLLVAVALCWSAGFAQEKISSDKTIPIMAWASIPVSETNAERFSELSEMGINVCLNTYPNVESMINALDLAQKTGLQMITSCPELKTDTENTVKRIMNHQALLGYFIKDEPVRKDFAELAELTKKIAAIDSRHICFVNMISSIHPAKTEALGAPTYAEFIRTFIQEVPVQLLSFDFYPVLVDDIHERWYEGLEIFSAEARKSDKPFWAFALASSYNELHPVPTVAAIRLQQYSNLAYGAQGLEYWAYWMNQSLRCAPIGMTGKRTMIYDRIKAVNQEIQAVSGVFAGSEVVSVKHTGTVIPRGTSRLEKLPWAVKVFETGGAGALVSVLENGENSFFVVVNRDLNNPLTMIILGDESLKKVLKDGSVVRASVYENKTEIEPGDIAIYMFPTKNRKQ